MDSLRSLRSGWADAIDLRGHRRVPAMLPVPRRSVSGPHPLIERGERVIAGQADSLYTIDPKLSTLRAIGLSGGEAFIVRQLLPLSD